METIFIAKSDEALAGTNLMLTTMQMTSKEAAQALCDELPKRGYPVLTPSRPDSIPGVH